MGQLTNQFVSQSYQGLLNLENANTGVTATLQYVTDGVGNRLPMLASTSSIVITGSFRGDGSGLTGVTTTLPSGVVSGSAQIVELGFATTSSVNTLSGSIAATDLGQNNRLTSLEGITGSLQNQINQKLDTGSFNTYTSSVNTKLAGLDIETGSLQNQIDALATTGSLSGYTTITVFNNYTSSNDSKVNSLIAGTGSYATTSSLTALSQSIATTDLGQDNRLGSIEQKTGSYATTGSNQFNGNQSITGSIRASSTVTSLDGFVGGYLQSSTNLSLSGNQLVDIKTNTTGTNGKVRLYSNGGQPFKVEVTGSLEVSNGITGSLLGTASYATQALSASWAPDNSNRNGLITTGSIGGTQSITGSLNVEGTISATSASFTYVNTVYETASVIYSSGSNQLGDAEDDTQTLWGAVKLPSGSLSITGSLRSTGEIRTDGGVVVGTTLLVNNIENPAGSGDITINTSPFFKVAIDGDTEVTGTLKVTNGITGSLQGTASYATQALSASYAPDTTNTGSLVSDVTLGIVSSSVSVTKGDGTTSQFTINDVNNATSASFATNATSSSFSQYTISGSFSDFATSASFATNALSSSHAINADTASFYGGTVVSASYAVNAATASIANDLIVVAKNNNASTLTRGTIVRIVGANGDNPLIDSASWTDDFNSANTLGMLSEDVASNDFANVVVQGKVIGINTNGMPAGALLFLSSSGQYTTSSVPAPYHEVRLGQVLRDNVNNGSAYITIDNGYELTELHDVDITNPVDGDLLVYRSGSYGIWQNETGGEIGLATTSSVNQKLDTGSFNTYTASMDARTGSYITTGSAASSQSITGSLILSGSAGPELDVKGDVNITGSLNNKGNIIVSNTSMTNTFNNVSSSVDGNILFGWDGTVPQNVATMSLVISGSNNILSAARPQGTNGYFGYVSGSNNLMLGATTTLITGSILRPQIQNNIVNSGNALLGFSSSSVAGGQPSITSNILNSQFSIQLAAVSGSITAGNNIINGNTTISHAPGPIANFRNTFSSNNINSTFTVSNLQSSSFTVINNNTVGAAHSINNYFNNPFGTQGITVSRNFFSGQSNGIHISGSPATNATRAIGDSFIGGFSSAISGSVSGSDVSNGSAIFMYGRNLVANATSATNAGGNAFLGRFNDTGSLANTNDIVLAVGTGTAVGTRRTGLYVTTGSLVGVSGSLEVIGTSNFRGGTIRVSGSEFRTNNYVIYEGSPNDPGPMSNFVGTFMTDRNTFTFNNILQSQLTTGSNFSITTNTGSTYTNITFDASYAGTDTLLNIGNYNGSRNVDVITDTMTITGSVNISSVMKLQALNPLPGGTLGELAVSSSNELYFHNGTSWNLIS
jgi:hypothetical protein